MFSDPIKDSNNIVWNALEFAAFKHRLQRRKGNHRLPYINHPIAVTGILQRFGETDPELLSAALLHDVLEDTDSSEEELKVLFGEHITKMVMEVTDDMTLLSKERKALQIKHAAALSTEAKKIKIADKTANTLDLYKHPLSWSITRKKRYIQWARNVVKECRGVNKALEDNFYRVADLCEEKLQENP